MPTKVYWVGLDHKNRSEYWDCTMIGDLLDGQLWLPPGFPEFEYSGTPDAFEPGSVIVVPGFDFRDRTAEINANLKPAALAMIVKDEGCAFPWRNIRHDDMPMWVQNASPMSHDSEARGFPVGYAPFTRRHADDGGKTMDWFFSGQAGNTRRRDCVAQLKILAGGECNVTKGFTQGFPPEEYTGKLASAKVAPCPGGIITPDSFRVSEALDLGCIPLADEGSGAYKPHNYWPFMLGEEPGFPTVTRWTHAPRIIEDALAGWPGTANKCTSWWAGYKRRLAHRLMDDLRGKVEECSRPGDRITVLMPTSPIPSHPSTAIIEETIASLQAQAGLHGCEIFIMCDGIRRADEGRRADYEEYVRRLIRLCRGWQNVWPIVFDEHMHQAGMTKVALTHVRTPAVLFVEHDTPVTGEIPWENLCDAVQGEADAIRLHHETHVLDCHKYLMLDETPRDVAGVPLVRTIQWSQRPHIANADFYRRFLEEDFDLPQEKWMIEVRMHSVVQSAWDDGNGARYRLWMYHPDGNIKRSTHLDGRAGAEAREMD